jgi:hypothetical protein
LPTVSPAYFSRLETLTESARRVQHARAALDAYDAMAARRRAALEEALTDAMAAFLTARQGFLP